MLYTTPLKALSNQKFDQLGAVFDAAFGAQRVGLVTGDHKANEDAPCLVMTTEVLHRRLLVDFNSAEKRKEKLGPIEWVVFDEAHYIQGTMGLGLIKILLTNI